METIIKLSLSNFSYANVPDNEEFMRLSAELQLNLNVHFTMRGDIKVWNVEIISPQKCGSNEINVGGVISNSL